MTQPKDSWTEERDAAAEKHHEKTKGFDGYMDEEFIAGANWAQARALEREKVLVEALIDIRSVQPGVYDPEYKDMDFNTYELTVSSEALAKWKEMGGK